MSFETQEGQPPVLGVPTSVSLVKRFEWLSSARFETLTQNAQSGSLTVVRNQYATSAPLGETFALIAPVPGAGVLIGGFKSCPLWVMR